MKNLKKSLAAACAIFLASTSAVYANPNLGADVESYQIRTQARKIQRANIGVVITGGFDFDSFSLLNLDHASSDLLYTLTSTNISFVSSELESFVLQVQSDITSDVTFDLSRNITGQGMRFTDIFAHTFTLENGRVIGVDTGATHIGASGVFSVNIPVTIGDNVVLLVSLSDDGVVMFGSYIEALDPNIRTILESRRLGTIGARD